MLVQMSWKSGIKSLWLSDDLQNCSLQALQVTVFNWAGLKVDFKCLFLMQLISPHKEIKPNICVVTHVKLSIKKHLTICPIS